MHYYVYILYSQKLNKFYKGQTNDIEKRLKRHNDGYEKSTKSGIPWILLWNTNKSNRSEAIVLESKLKNLSRVRLLDFMLKNDHDIKNNNLEFIKWLGIEQ